MRPAHVPLHAPDDPAALAAAKLRVAAEATFTPRGGGVFDPRARLKRRIVALRGSPDALVLVLGHRDRRVRLKVLASGEATSDDVAGAIEAGRRLTAVDDDPSDFLERVAGVALLGDLARRVDVRLGRTPTVFESLAVAIVEQLVTGFEARAAIRRLWKIAGAPVDGARLVAAPTARAVARVPLWRLHEIGVGASRAVTLHRSALRGAAVERLAASPPEEFVARLQSLPGVGPWTANATARAALGWSDAVPVGDFHAPFFISEALGVTGLDRGDRAAADAAMLEVLEPFRPHRGRVALLLEHHVLGQGTWRPPRVDRHRREPWRY